MDKLQFISKNLLIAGETGSGKTYFLRYLINQILEKCDEKPVIYVHDLKGVNYRRIINNLNIFKYNEAEIFVLIDRIYWLLWRLWDTLVLLVLMYSYKDIIVI